jgi:hypothetical protein
MDKITSSCVAEFISQYEIPDVGESENFEKFCHFCLISKEYNGQFSVEEIGTDPGTQGIDGIGIIVPIPLILATDSEGIWPAVPMEGGHLFRSIVATLSERSDAGG